LTKESPSVTQVQQVVEVHDVAELAAARHDMALFLHSHSLPAAVAYDLLTCVHEAAKNALHFAASPCGVQISVSVGPREVLATVRDHGAGLDLERVPTLQPDPFSEAGRGLFLLLTLMDHVEFRIVGGTEVRLHKQRLKTADEGHAA
jgi:anti-sigma regulatory factor (Ser/Thr protein kinase)